MMVFFAISTNFSEAFEHYRGKGTPYQKSLLERITLYTMSTDSFLQVYILVWPIARTDKN